uniref:Conserved plasma membrane protein n=1 Tax=Steinernema glaseri TaxID=37863 RepID=A0A1I7ZQ71_9BILA
MLRKEWEGRHAAFLDRVCECRTLSERTEAACVSTEGAYNHASYSLLFGGKSGPGDEWYFQCNGEPIETMSPSLAVFRIIVFLLLVVYVCATYNKRSIALGRLSLRPGKRSPFSSSDSLEDLLNVVRLPAVAAQCSNAHVETITGGLKNLARLLDEYSFYLEKCRDLGYST